MRQSHADIIHQLNQELVEMREAYNQLDTERQNLLDQLQKQSIAAEQDQIRRMTGMFLFHIANRSLTIVFLQKKSRQQICGTKHSMRSVLNFVFL